MINQETILEVATKLQLNSSFRHTGHFNAEELSKAFPVDDVVESFINFYGGSPTAFEFNWWKHSIQQLITVYGEQLRAICEYRRDHPFHSGGTAYGQSHIKRSKELCSLYCERVLGVLDAS